MQTKRMSGLIAGFVLSLSVPSLGITRYVTTSGTGSAGCSDCDNARTLPAARSAAQSGDVVWLAAGTYDPITLKIPIDVNGDPRNVEFIVDMGACETPIDPGPQ